jgi:hypothetical protein
LGIELGWIILFLSTIRRFVHDAFPSFPYYNSTD